MNLAIILYIMLSSERAVRNSTSSVFIYSMYGMTHSLLISYNSFLYQKWIPLPKMVISARTSFEYLFTWNKYVRVPSWRVTCPACVTQSCKRVAFWSWSRKGFSRSATVRIVVRSRRLVEEVWIMVVLGLPWQPQSLRLGKTNLRLHY